MRDSKGNPLTMPKQRKKICEHVQKKVTYEDIGIAMPPEKEAYGVNAFGQTVKIKDERKVPEKKYFVDAKVERKLTLDKTTM